MELKDVKLLLNIHTRDLVRVTLNNSYGVCRRFANIDKNEKVTLGLFYCDYRELKRRNDS